MLSRPRWDSIHSLHMHWRFPGSDSEQLQAKLVRFLAHYDATGESLDFLRGDLRDRFPDDWIFACSAIAKMRNLRDFGLCVVLPSWIMARAPGMVSLLQPLQALETKETWTLGLKIDDANGSTLQQSLRDAGFRCRIVRIVNIGDAPGWKTRRNAGKCCVQVPLQPL